MKWQLIFILVLMIPFVLGELKECEDIQLVNKIPCEITSTWNYTQPCSGHIAKVYNITGNNTINFTFSGFPESPFCVFTWNVTRLGSYVYSVDTGDTGNITVEAPDNMFAIIIGLSIVMIFFMILALLHEAYYVKIIGYGIALIQFLNIFYILYINELNQPLAPTLKINFISALWLIFGIGFFMLIRIVIKMMGWEDTEPEEARKWGR